MVVSFLESVYTYLAVSVNSFIPNYLLPQIPIILQILLLLVVAFITGKIVKIISLKILTIIGLKRITSKSWAETILKATGYNGSIIELISDLVKWLVYILFFSLIIQILGLVGVAGIFTSIASFIPRFIGAILIIVIGFIIADFFGKIFEEASRSFLQEDILSSVSGAVIKYTISLITIIMALSLIGLDVISITIAFSVILVAIITVLILGIKDIFPNYTAGMQIKKLVKPGEFITVGQYTGIVEKIESFSVIIRDGQKKIAIPNTLFLSRPIEKRAK